MPLRRVSLDDLVIEDEGSFGHVALYHRLKRALKASGHQFHVPAKGTSMNWDRAVFLNLTFWSAKDGTDVLCDERIPADVVAHVAWHHIVGVALDGATASAPPTAAMLLFAESIASAFDLYLVGRLLRNAPDSDFMATQIPIMSEAAQEAGLSEAAFSELLTDVSNHPERAFEDLRELLVDVGTALFECREPVLAQAALESFAVHRFGPLLHHYQLSNWVLYARAYAAAAPGSDDILRGLDATLRAAPDALAWLDAHWVGA